MFLPKIMRSNIKLRFSMSNKENIIIIVVVVVHSLMLIIKYFYKHKEYKLLIYIIKKLNIYNIKVIYGTIF